MHVPWYRGFLIGLLIVLIVWVSSLIFGLVGKARLAVSEKNDIERQYQSLQVRKAALREDLSMLATARGRDMAIRTAFGVARPGEEVIVVVPPIAEAPTSTPSWWERVLGWF